MQGVEGQFYFDLRLEGLDEPIYIRDIESISIDSVSGGDLPKAIFKFFYTESIILSKIKEESKVTFILKGDEDKTEIVTKWNISFPDHSRHGDGKYFIVLKCVLDHLSHLSDWKSRIFFQKHSVEVMAAIADEGGFKFKTNCVIGYNVDDKMNWVQSAEPNNRFENEVSFHAYLPKYHPDTFPLLSIDTESYFRWFDIKRKAIEEKPRFIVSPNEKDLTVDIVVNKNYQVIVGSGITNKVGAYGKFNRKYDAISGEHTTLEYRGANPPMMTSKKAKGSPRHTKDKSRPSHFGNNLNRIEPDNVHPQWLPSYLYNTTNSLLMSGIQLRTIFRHQFVDIRVGDLILFKDEEVVNEDGIAINYSGLYIVGRVITTLRYQQIVTRVDLYSDKVNLEVE